MTWAYDHQGFRASGTTVVAGAGAYGGSYGGVFHFREVNGVKLDEAGKDPFAQTVPITGMKFNTHLGAQGLPLGASSATGPR